MEYLEIKIVYSTCIACGTFIVTYSYALVIWCCSFSVLSARIRDTVELQDYMASVIGDW